ncbi:hypothetical protein L596_017706 [Steinernema carpocapsae]|uniref:Uncharacterized protein n=1 Tax=Steinernema carpocapsae TaxID=34508 RepID=A0A4U5N2T9_STECR|nr:hypothetical protein L596_017706 [Steinernema carpocapsae]
MASAKIRTSAGVFHPPIRVAALLLTFLATSAEAAAAPKKKESSSDSTSIAITIVITVVLFIKLLGLLGLVICYFRMTKMDAEYEEGNSK